MIISNKRVNLATLLNFDDLPRLLQTMSSDLIDRIDLKQTPESVTLRCHLKLNSVLPLFAHVLLTKVNEEEFDVSNVDDPYPAVQLLVRESRCRLRFLDEHTAEFDGHFSLKNRVSPSSARSISDIVAVMAIRLKTFVESV